jgi:hypothetical protein
MLYYVYAIVFKQEVRRRAMATQKTGPTIAVAVNTAAFHNGFVEGLTGEYCRVRLNCPVTEDGIVEIMRNLCEIAQEGWLKEELLRHDAGLLAGWLSRQAQEGRA